MLNEILKLIIDQAQAEHDISLQASLRQIMLSIQNIIDTKIIDLGRVRDMEIPDKEKVRLTNIILHVD